MNLKGWIGTTLSIIGLSSIGFSASLTGFAISDSSFSGSIFSIFGLVFVIVGLAMFVSREDISKARHGLPPGTFYCPLEIKYKHYTLYAYPGPDAAAEGGRVEHLPLHIHVKSPQIEGDLKIRTESIEEIKGFKIPKDLRKFLTEHKNEIAKRAENVFRQGKIN